MSQSQVSSSPACESALRPRTSSARWLLRLGALSMCTLIPFSAASPAWAHDTLLSSSPEADEVLDQPLDEVVLEFSGTGLIDGESISNVIQVLDSEQQDWATEAVIDGSTASADIEDELPDGSYEIVYRVVYSDGHVEEDTIPFQMDTSEEPSQDDHSSAEAQTQDLEEQAPAPAEEPDDPEEQDSGQESGVTDTAGRGLVPVGLLLTTVAAVVAAGLTFLIKRRHRTADQKQETSTR